MYIYSQHEFIKMQRVAGLLLQPFCLGHADILCGLDSSLYRGEIPELSDLATALFVCSRSPEKARRQIRSGRANKAMGRLGRRFGAMGVDCAADVYDVFEDYMTTYSGAPPRWEEPGEKQESRTPWHLSVFCIIQEKTNLTAGQTWALPVARAFELAAVIGANHGDDSLVSLAEMDVYNQLMASDEEPAPACGHPSNGGDLNSQDVAGPTRPEVEFHPTTENQQPGTEL